MKKFVFKLIKFLSCFGVDLLRPYTILKGLINFYIKDYFSLKKQLRDKASFGYVKLNPVFTDRYCFSGTANGAYFYQDLLVAQLIFRDNPPNHLDVGSRVDGFIAHLASFREVDVVDIRPLNSKISNINYKQLDLMGDCTNLFGEYSSISSLHAIEHFGLGRYGDVVDIDGSQKGMDNIYSILKKGGKFYFSVPIGPQRIEFNAHRVFSMSYLLDYFKTKYIINSFSYVDDFGELHQNICLEDEMISNSFGCNYGCGIFELIKI